MKEINYIPDFAGNFRLLYFATGSYSCVCTVCNKHFIGAKHAVQCLACAIEEATKQMELIEQKTKSIQDVIVALKTITPGNDSDDRCLGIARIILESIIKKS